MSIQNLFSFVNAVPTIPVVVMTIVIASIICGGFVTLCIVRTVQCVKSSNPSFRDNVGSYIGSIIVVVMSVILVWIIWGAYYFNDSVYWGLFFLFLVIGGSNFIVFLGYNIYRITFYPDEIHLRTHFGKKRIYKYADITDCFYGTKRGHLFVQIEFNGGEKRLDMRVSGRLILALEEKKIKISKTKSTKRVNKIKNDLNKRK